MRVAVVMVAALLLFPFVARGATINALQGVTLGENVSDVTAAIGPPILLRQMPDGSYASWNRTKSQDAFMLIGERADRVTLIRLVAARPGKVENSSDPFGISLGDTADQVAATRGKPSHVYQTPEPAVGYATPGGTWVYLLRDGSVHAVMLASNEQPSASSGPPIHDPHDGSSTAAAYILNAKNEDEGVHFEYFYTATLGGCGGGWKVTRQSLISQKDRNYDALDLVCPDSNKEMTVYFDISSFFGKLGD